MDCFQLSNIFYMKDQTTAKHALLQVILAMTEGRDVTPMDCSERGMGHSMHDLEEGHLGWQDAKQWSFNRLSASRISMATSHQHQLPQHKKVCKFFNEGSCSHEFSHGQYKNTSVPSVISKGR